MEPSLDRVVELIGQYEPAVVALQEVDVSCPRTDNVHQAEEIASRLGMSHHFYCLVEWEDFPYSNEPSGQYGLAFLCHSSLHPRRIRRWELPLARQSSEPRGIFQIDIDWEGMPLSILNTHLSVQRRERLQQLGVLVHRIGQLREQDKSCILLGDFNTSGRPRPVRALERLAPECVPDKPQRATFPSRFPLLRLDRVFASPDLKCVRSRVIRSPLSRSASDHLPVAVELTR